MLTKRKRWSSTGDLTAQMSIFREYETGCLLETDYIKRSCPAVIDVITFSVSSLSWHSLRHRSQPYTMASEKDVEVCELVKLFSAMTLEDDVIQGVNIEAAGQPTWHINSAQASLAVDAMDVDAEEPARVMRPCREGFLETSHTSLTRNRLIEAAGQPTPHINSAQSRSTVDTIGIDPEEPTQVIEPYRKGFETSHTSLTRNRLSIQGTARHKSRLSAMVRGDVITFFTNNYEQALREWTSLLRETTFPLTIASSDPRFLEAFSTLDSVIAESQVSLTLARFAHLRLIQLLSFLRDVIKSEGEKGQICKERGRCNASYALDIYLCAQKHPLTVEKRKLVDRQRFSRRWTKLAGPSPFFLMIYSCTARTVV